MSTDNLSLTSAKESTTHSCANLLAYIYMTHHTCPNPNVCEQRAVASLSALWTANKEIENAFHYSSLELPDQLESLEPAAK